MIGMITWYPVIYICICIANNVYVEPIICGLRLHFACAEITSVL